MRQTGKRRALPSVAGRLALCGLMAGMLAACGSADSDSASGDAAKSDADQAAQTDSLAAKEKKAPPPPACPQVAAVRDLAHYAVATAADTGKITPDQILYIADFGHITGSCDSGDAGTHVSADVEIVLHAGAALPTKLDDGDSAVVLPYFVAAVGPDNQILAKQSFTLKADLRKVLDPDNSPHEPIDIQLPIGSKTEQVLIGFQLSPAQLVFSHNLEAAPHAGSLGPMPRLPGVPAVPGMPNGRAQN